MNLMTPTIIAWHDLPGFLEFGTPVDLTMHKYTFNLNVEGSLWDRRSAPWMFKVWACHSNQETIERTCQNREGERDASACMRRHQTSTLAPVREHAITVTPKHRNE